MKTEILMLLDASGSMQAVHQKATDACNQFIRDQKKVDGELGMRIEAFNRERTPLFDSAVDGWHKAYISKENYRPDGVTALYDAIGYCIEELGDRLSRRNKNQLPDKVVFVVQTDGFENASQVFTADKVNEMITHQRTKYSWEFVFLGADQDAMPNASRIGIPSVNTMSYGSADTKRSFAAMSASVANYRTGASLAVDVSNVQ